MDGQETPPSEDDLYEARGLVPLACPIMQGDIFQHVPLPGFDEQPPAVMIVQHPCSMRDGAKLRSRLTVAAVRPSAKIGKIHWNGYAWAIPLPNMLGDGADFLGDFRDVGSISSEELTRSRRVAALTSYGVHLLHRRMIFYQTRLSIDIYSGRDFRLYSHRAGATVRMGRSGSAILDRECT